MSNLFVTYSRSAQLLLSFWRFVGFKFKTRAVRGVSWCRGWGPRGQTVPSKLVADLLAFTISWWHLVNLQVLKCSFLSRWVLFCGRGCERVLANVLFWGVLNLNSDFVICGSRQEFLPRVGRVPCTHRICSRTHANIRRLWHHLIVVIVIIIFVSH